MVLVQFVRRCRRCSCEARVLSCEAARSQVAPCTSAPAPSHPRTEHYTYAALSDRYRSPSRRAAAGVDERPVVARRLERQAQDAVGLECEPASSE